MQIPLKKFLDGWLETFVYLSDGDSNTASHQDSR